MSQDEPQNIVIVGAGVAGLSAAAALFDKASQAGKKAPHITIVEASDRIGGRIKSSVIDSSGTVIDEGAGWLHQSEQGNPFFDFCQGRYHAAASDVLVLPPGYARRFVIDGHSAQPSPAVYEGLESAYQNFCQQHSGQDISLSTLAGHLNPEHFNQEDVRFFLQRAASNYMGVDHADQVSAHEFFTDPYTGFGPVVRQGFSSYTDLMAEELRAKGVQFVLNTRVTGINCDTATFKAQNGTVYHADQAIVTLPFGVIKSGSVNFNNTLSRDMETYVDGVQVANMSKIFLPLDQAFLQASAARDGYGIYHVKTEPELQSFMYAGVHEVGKPLLYVLAGGKTARDIEDMAQNGETGKRAIEEVIDTVLKPVDGLQNWRSHLTGDIVVTHWNSDPDFQGAYTTMKPGFARKGPIRSGRVVFAGEALNAESGGSVAAAHQSGLEAGEMVFEP